MHHHAFPHTHTQYLPHAYIPTHHTHTYPHIAPIHTHTPHTRHPIHTHIHPNTHPYIPTHHTNTHRPHSYTTQDDDFASEQDRQLWHTIRRALLDTQPRPIPYIPTATHTHTAGTAAGVGRGQGRVEEGNTESRGVGNTTESRAGGTEGHAVESHSGGDTGGRDTGGRDTGGGASVKRSSGGDAQQEEQQGAGNREGGGVLSMWDLASTRRVRGRYMGHCNLHTGVYYLCVCVCVLAQRLYRRGAA